MLVSPATTSAMIQSIVTSLVAVIGEEMSATCHAAISIFKTSLEGSEVPWHA